MKKCRLCEKVKELFEFGFDKYEFDGRNARCKLCINTIKKNKNFVAIIDGEKKCMHCKKMKSLTEFCNNKSNQDGRHYWCKECSKNKQKEYRVKNPLNWERQRHKNFIKWREKIDIDPEIKIKNKKGDGYINQAGYLSYRKKGHPCADKNDRVQASHLVVYERTGYVLKKGESVHHKNGMRLDNSFENLEVWSTSQPAGQRIIDKIEWCKQFIKEHSILDNTSQN